MFERSLIASQLKHASPEERWTALASVTLQVGLAAAIIALPLLHPDRLALHLDTPNVVVPLLKVNQPKPPQATVSTSTNSIAVPTQTTIFTAPPQIPTGISDHDPAPMTIGPIGQMGQPIPNSLLASDSTPVRVTPEVRKSTPVRISAGVSTGLLLVPIRPLYPAFAKAAEVQGTVVVEAVISKTGHIESLHVVSGPEMLRRAALDAIQLARYQPFQLNGEPTEVQTCITLNFRLGQ